MSCKTIVTLLLLSCLGATGTALGVPEEAPLEGGVKAFPQPLTIKAVRWLITDASTNVQVCVEIDLPPGTPTLTYDDKINPIVIVGGVRDDPDLKCATFAKVGKYTFNEVPARYELTVADTDDPNDFLGRGFSTFAITVRSILLKCGGSLITKVTWSGSEILSAFQCIVGSSNFNKVCYLDEDITGRDLCFVVKDAKEVDVNVCLNEPIDNRPTAIGPINLNYFYYGPEAVPNVPADAILSLTMTTAGLTNMRAIVRPAEDLRSPEATRVAQVFGCSTTDCTFPKYERKLATYEVCLEAMDASLSTLKTATTTFTDLKLYAFDGGFQKGMLLECVFANALPDRTYTASLFDKLPELGVDSPLDTINIDCTGVLLDHACFGYLDTDLGTGTTVYVTVSGSDGSNTIIVPFAIP